MLQFFLVTVIIYIPGSVNKLNQKLNLQFAAKSKKFTT